MTVPKVPASTAKLFSKRRMRRQVVVDSASTDEAKKTVDTKVEPAKIEATPAPATEASKSVDPSSSGSSVPMSFRRR